MKFSKALRHIDMKDVKNKRLQKEIAKIKEQKKEEEFKQYLVSTMKTKKYSWREGMTTSDVSTIGVDKATGDGNVAVIDAIDSESYETVKMDPQIGNNGVVDGAFVGTEIRDSGTGSGVDGGFDVGGKYLAFQGTGDSYNNARFAILSPIDSSKVDTLTITAIVGDGANGGEEPDLQAECLFVYYKTPAMEFAAPLSVPPGGSTFGPDDDVIIRTPLDGQNGRRTNNGGLNDYSIAIPDYARAEGTQFVLYQNFNSGAAFDNYGITKINFQRKAPLSVVVPLDNPEASSFIRSAPEGSTPKKRKKDVNDKLEASDEYTQAKFGNEFPGQEVRVGGDDPFASAKIGDDVEPSPQGKDEVTKSFADFQKGDQRVEVIKTPEQIQAQNDEYFADLQNLLVRNEYDYADPQVLEISDRILKLDPKNIDAYYYKSAYYDVAGDIEGAKKVVDEMVKNNPDSSDGYALRSFYRQEEGDLAGAIEDLEKTIELDPDPEYVAYMEMELADLKFQEAEVETDNAERERIESEAAAMQEKAHKDYWDNADLIEQEEPIEYEYIDDETLLNDFLNGITSRRGSAYEKGLSRDEIANLQVGVRERIADYTKNIELPEKVGNDYFDFMYMMQTWKGTPDEFADYYADWELAQDPDDRGTQILYHNREYHKAALRMFNAGYYHYSFKGSEYNTDNIKGLPPDELIDQFRYSLNNYRFHTERMNEDGGGSDLPRYHQTQARVLGEYLRELSKNLPDEFFEGRVGAEPINTLYDQMKALYDEEDPEKEIKTELKELGFDKQYKDLMNAWSSKDKFSKFITPLKNLSDALLGSKTAQNAKYENYKIAIAKSIMLNKPIRVNPDTIDPLLIQKLGDRITPNQILDYDEEQRYNAANETYRKLAKEGKINSSLIYDYEMERMMQGSPVIPIVSEPVPYADENIYEDEFGRVFTNDGSVANNTFQPDKAYHGFASAYVNDIMETNPLAGRGQAQYQIVVPPDGTEPYLLYKDHAYYNMESDDKGEAPGLNERAARFVGWLGNTAHNRGDGDANTGGMAGYPPNIRGDVITEIRIKLTDLPEDVQGAVYRHPLMTEQPELVQALKDTIYTDKNIKKIAGSKDLHNLYMLAVNGADKLKDLAVDKGIELIMGIPSIEGTKNDLRSASNMLQRYDDYIQQTTHTPDGKTYIPGYTTPDGGVVNRIDVTDEFVKGDQNHLKGMFNDDEDIQKILRAYVKGDTSKTSLSNVLQARIGDIMNASNPAYRKVLANSLGRGTRVNVDEFLNGKIVLEKNFEFRDETVDSNWFVDTVAALFDVSTDTAAAGGVLTSLATMTAARQLLRPVRGPATDWRKNLGYKETFAQAMNNAPKMPYKLEFDFSDKMMNILRGIEDEDRPKDDSDLGSAGEIGGVDATAAATLAGRRKKNNRKVNESNLYERLKKKSFFNPDDIKPEFPENPPPKLDPKTGKHPQYGKKANRYKKLDPISANSMPPTGDPEIDAVVNKQKTINKIKKMAKNK